MSSISSSERKKNHGKNSCFFSRYMYKYTVGIQPPQDLVREVVVCQRDQAGKWPQGPCGLGMEGREEEWRMGGREQEGEGEGNIDVL